MDHITVFSMAHQNTPKVEITTIFVSAIYVINLGVPLSSSLHAWPGQ